MVQGQLAHKKRRVQGYLAHQKRRGWRDLEGAGAAKVDGEGLAEPVPHRCKQDTHGVHLFTGQRLVFRDMV